MIPPTAIGAIAVHISAAGSYRSVLFCVPEVNEYPPNTYVYVPSDAEAPPYLSTGIEATFCQPGGGGAPGV